jgi:murein L,D-transpeptidase YcbB/YkuD
MEETTKEFDNRTPLGLASTFRYRSQAFSGRSDHAEFTEATTRVPCVMLLQWPDLFYHTSMDTIDKVSEDSLKRVGWVATVAALTLANVTHEDIFTLAYQTASKGMTRIMETSVEAVKELIEKKTQMTKNEKNKLANELAKTAAYYTSKIEHVVWREQQSVKSVKRLGEHPELTTLIDKHCEDIRNLGKSETRKLEETLNFIAKTSAITLEKLEETQADQEAKRLAPKKLFKGTLNDDVLKKAIGEEEYEWYELIDDKDEDFSKKMAEILNFMDGKRNAHDIIKAVSAEYSPTDPENVMKFLKDLKKAKLVTF